jgi:probable F420-dependent oxidoreductase
MDERDALRSRLGRVGVWTFAFDTMPVADVRAAAVGIEELGFPALWVPEGGRSRDVFAHLSVLLGATTSITVASGIANITARAPEVMQAGAVTLADAFGDRCVLGIGVGHEYSTEARGLEWAHPVARMEAYLDRMDAPGGPPPPRIGPRRLLAALGPRMLRLSAERALGAHSYFVPVEHTAWARGILGPGPLLAVELTAAMNEDPAIARETAHRWAEHYLELPNYARNWRRLGFSDDDVAGSGSERLIEAGISCGDAGTVVARAREHLDAGADHVCVQVIDPGEPAAGLRQISELAPALLAL